MDTVLFLPEAGEAGRLQPMSPGEGGGAEDAFWPGFESPLLAARSPHEFN